MKRKVSKVRRPEKATVRKVTRSECEVSRGKVVVWCGDVRGVGGEEKRRFGQNSCF